MWSTPPASTTQSVTVGGGANTNLGYSCNAFNPAVSMSNAMNDIENSAENISESILSNATSAIGAFPMYELEKASPELYNLIQNSMTEAQDTFNISTKSCQDSLRDIRNGKSPYEDWFPSPIRKAGCNTPMPPKKIKRLMSIMPKRHCTKPSTIRRAMVS